MASNNGQSGLIFLSYSKEDSAIVNEVARQIPRSHLFHDISTMDPGENNVEQMKAGVMAANVYAMFVSPSADASVWVQYEAAIAEVEKIKRSNIKVVAIPIKGASYKNAPPWLQAYFATNEHYSPRDIGRLLRQLFEEVLRKNGDLEPEVYVGREPLETKVLRHVRTAPTQSGIPINLVILHSLQGMGRTTLAKRLLPKLFPGMRASYFELDVQRQADAYDFFLALRGDNEGELSEERLEALAASWPKHDPRKMAEVLLANFAHYENLGQPIVIQCARGIRDFGPGSGLKTWAEHLFDGLMAHPNLKLIWISEVAVPARDLARFRNVSQFEVTEIDPDAIFVLLTELLSTRDISPLPLQAISGKIGGHPGTAHWVAETIKLGRRSPEAIEADPGFVTAYQQQFVEELLERRNLSDAAFAVLQMLCILPSLDFEAIVECLKITPRNDVAATLNHLTEMSLISYSLSVGYKVPEIVRSVFLIKHPEVNTTLIGRVAAFLGARIKGNQFTISAANSLIFAYVLLGEKIPEAIRSIVTAATLHELVYEQYQLGMRFHGEFRKHFENAAKLAELVDIVPMGNDAFETVVFYGADALIRIGGNPSEAIKKLESRGLGAADFIKGNAAYKFRDINSAKKHLQTALAKGAFTGRTARLLGKIFHDIGEPAKALEVFDKLEGRVDRDSGMLAQKIRCLRAVGRHQDAEALMKNLKGLPDDYGHYEMMQAARHFRNREFEPALEAVQRAALKPKADRVNLSLLEVSIRVESGDASGVEQACNLAVGVGRSEDALCLKARVALKHAGGWKEAEQLIRQIEKPNFYDKVVLLRALNQKVAAPETVADPTTEAAVRAEVQKLTLETRATPEDFDR